MNTLQVANNKKRIAIVSHLNKKIDLINWSYENRKLLKQYDLVAPWQTAGVLEGTVDTYVYKLADADAGGDKDLVRLMNEGKVDLMVFIWDPLQANTYESNVPMLLANAVEANIAVACNIPTANLVLSSLNLQNQQQDRQDRVYLHAGESVKPAVNTLLNVV
jgi:methylglyoxal synthase